MFGQLLEKVRSLRRKAKGKAAYRACLLAAVDDGVLTPDEIEALEQTREDLGLSPDDVRDMRVAAYKRAFLVAASDRRITAAESAELDRIRTHLGITASEVADTDYELQRLRLLAEIQEGNLPVAAVPGLILLKGEEPHWCEPAQLIEERVVRRRYEGGSRGVSIRIIKGVTYRVGAHRGHLVTDTAHVPVSAGDFVITNKRTVFKGDRKSFNYRLDKLLGMELFSDGLSLADSTGKNRLLRFEAAGNTELVGAVLSQVVNNIDER